MPAPKCKKNIVRFFLCPHCRNICLKGIWNSNSYYFSYKWQLLIPRRTLLGIWDRFWFMVLNYFVCKSLLNLIYLLSLHPFLCPSLSLFLLPVFFWYSSNSSAVANILRDCSTNWTLGVFLHSLIPVCRWLTIFKRKTNSIQLQLLKGFVLKVRYHVSRS